MKLLRKGKGEVKDTTREQNVEKWGSEGIKGEEVASVPHWICVA